jgi:hypothetical protein
MAPEQWKQVVDENRDLCAKLESLSDENKRLRDALASLGLIGVIATDLDLSDVGAVEESGPGIEGSDTPAPAEPESDGQDAGGGSSELHGDDALNELIAGI